MAETLLGLGLGLGFLLFILAITVACYVIYSISHMKALKALGYRNAWLAWIPYGSYFACADSVSEGQEKIRLFDSFEIPAMVFKLWWIIPLAFVAIPLNERVEQLIGVVLNIVFLGCTYAKMYARLEGKAERDTQALGCVSGFIPIVAVVKFFMMK